MDLKEFNDYCLNSNKVGLFLEGVNLTPLHISRRTLYNCQTIYLKYVESEKNADIICCKLRSLVSL